MVVKEVNINRQYTLFNYIVKRVNSNAMSAIPYVKNEFIKRTLGTFHSYYISYFFNGIVDSAQFIIFLSDTNSPFGCVVPRSSKAKYRGVSAPVNKIVTIS